MSLAAAPGHVYAAGTANPMAEANMRVDIYTSSVSRHRQFAVPHGAAPAVPGAEFVNPIFYKTINIEAGGRLVGRDANKVIADIARSGYSAVTA